MQELHISNTGSMLLRGARVVSISDTEIKVSLSWASNDFVWKLNTRYNTTFISSIGDKQTLADIAVGDILTVTGTLSSNGAEPSIEADVVREE
jgi:hypothetical protein